MFSFHTKTKRSQVAFKSEILMCYSEVFLPFSRGLLEELQWHIDQNKIAVGKGASNGFLEIPIYLFGKVISLLDEKV